jgi:hypothetical protein
VNWVDTQFDQLDEDLTDICGGDKEDEELWLGFEKRFKRAYISSTAKENAYVKLQSLKMKGDQLDKYIADFSTLIGELGWDHNSEISCHNFQEGLPTPLAHDIIKMEGIPETLTRWIRLTQKYHSCWAMTQAFGYQGEKDAHGRFKPHFNPQKPKKKERDPDAMDVDYTQMSQDKKEQLIKSGSCFCCEKQGHLSRDCPLKKKASIQEAIVKSTKPKETKKQNDRKDDPPSYNSLLKQINACSMEDRQKILEVFSQDGSEPEDF